MSHILISGFSCVAMPSTITIVFCKSIRCGGVSDAKSRVIANSPSSICPTLSSFSGLPPHRLAHGAQRGREFSDLNGSWVRIALEVNFGNALVIAGGQAVENLRQPLPRAPVDPALDPKIDRHDGAVILHEQVPLGQFGVEEPGADSAPGLGYWITILSLHGCQIMTARAQFLDAADLDAVDPFDRHTRPLVRSQSIAGDAIAGHACHLFGQFGCRGRFTAASRARNWSSA